MTKKSSTYLAIIDKRPSDCSWFARATETNRQNHETKYPKHTCNNNQNPIFVLSHPLLSAEAFSLVFFFNVTCENRWYITILSKNNKNEQIYGFGSWNFNQFNSHRNDIWLLCCFHHFQASPSNLSNHKNLGIAGNKPFASDQIWFLTFLHRNKNVYSISFDAKPANSIWFNALVTHFVGMLFFCWSISIVDVVQRTCISSVRNV